MEFSTISFYYDWKLTVRLLSFLKELPQFAVRERYFNIFTYFHFG